MMKHLALFGAILVATCSYAGGFVDEPTCYSWNGGHKSAGSFTKCNPELQAWVKPAPPPVVAAPAAVPAPVVVPAVAPTPLMMPTCVNPVPPYSVPLKPKHKPRPRPKPTHKC